MKEPKSIDENIEINEIMAKIKENIRSRRISFLDSDTGSGSILNGSSGVEFSGEENSHRVLQHVTTNWNIKNNSYTISSHRPFVGKFLVTGRELVQGEVRRYVDPIVLKQNDFNEGTSNLLQKIYDKLERLDSKFNDRTEQLDVELKKLYDKLERLDSKYNGRVEQLDAEFSDKVSCLDSKVKTEIERLGPEFESRLSKQVNFIISSMDFELENKVWLKTLLDRSIKESLDTQRINSSDYEDLKFDYFAFEERFRGPRSEIRVLQEKFLQYFRDCSRVLDIGCGRGEFMELLGEEGIVAKGIDLDDSMVDFCRSRGLDVEKIDAINYLESLEDESLDGIFIDQMVEHLEPDYLTRMLFLCSRKLKEGCYLVVETVNLLSLVSFANFYIDLTHKKPVHPETLKFLYESYGFKEIDIVYSSPTYRLKKMTVNEDISEKEKAMVDIFNFNVLMLNNILYGAQDYAIIGRK